MLITIFIDVNYNMHEEGKWSSSDSSLSFKQQDHPTKISNTISMYHPWMQCLPNSWHGQHGWHCGRGWTGNSRFLQCLIRSPSRIRATPSLCQSYGPVCLVQLICSSLFLCLCLCFCLHTWASHTFCPQGPPHSRISCKRTECII